MEQDNSMEKDNAIQALFENNRHWAQAKLAKDSNFFNRLSHQQKPRYFWIGCADSRVPANEIIGLDPGEVFVHRNVANIANPTDLNFLSALTFAVNELCVEHIIICGHYGCGGVKAVIDNIRSDGGVCAHWLEPIRETYHACKHEINAEQNQQARVNLLCEANVKAQLNQLAKNIIVEDAWARGQSLTLHGWVYGIADGLLKNLNISIDRQTSS